MKFQADSVEFWSKDKVETVFFGNAEKELVLLMSGVSGSNGHYLEWNDQSNACTNGVDTIQISRSELCVRLLPTAAKQLGEHEIVVDFDCEDELFEEIVHGLGVIFKGKLLVKQAKATSPKKEAPKKDYSKIKYLNLEGKRLKKLPDYVREMVALETVKIASNPQLDLDDACEVLSHFPNLKELGFSTDGYIPENLGKLTQLETLSITDLTKSSVFPESFGQLKKLKSLLVMGDSDIVLPESFSNLTEIENLNLRVESWPLPARFYQLSKLKLLDFINCNFSQMPEEFAAMKEVETLTFGGREARDFAQIMPVVARMPNLKKLDFFSKPIPKEIVLCKNIETLLIWTGVREQDPLQLPDELFEMTELQTLVLSMNYFEKIPEGIGKMKGLKNLIIQEAVFESLPDSLGELSNLENLNLSQNPALKSLPESLGKLTQLKGLYLNDNPQLVELPLSLENLKNLTAVGLSNPETIKNVPESWDKLLEQF